MPAQSKVVPAREFGGMVLVDAEEQDLGERCVAVSHDRELNAPVSNALLPASGQDRDAATDRLVEAYFDRDGPVSWAPNWYSVRCRCRSATGPESAPQQQPRGVVARGGRPQARQLIRWPG
jgi:hypothetical protein